MGVRFRVRNFRALREVDLDLDEVTCVVGANGSGKTTLLFALEFAWAALRAGVRSARAAFGGFGLHNRDIGPRGGRRGILQGERSVVVGAAVTRVAGDARTKSSRTPEPRRPSQGLPRFSS